MSENDSKRTCHYCGMNISHRLIGAVYCDQSDNPICYTERRRKNSHASNKRVNFGCVICGKPCSSSNARCCSTTCAKEYRIKRQQETIDKVKKSMISCPYEKETKPQQSGIYMNSTQFNPFS